MPNTISQPDPQRLEIFKNIFHSIAEEMGAALRRSAFSPNIKERRDYSCAVYNSAGEVLAMGDHMPVHLGSMPASVAAARAALTLEPGDIAVLNDPFAGGTHLPDLTMVMPVFLPAATPGQSHFRSSIGNASRLSTRGKKLETSPRSARRLDRDQSASPTPPRNRVGLKSPPLFYVANRAHHSDIGGALAGSMGPAREIFEEGLRIPAVYIARRGELNRDVLAMILANCRTPAEREGDLAAQIAACHTGQKRLLEVAAKYGERELQLYGNHLLHYSENMMKSALRALKPGTYIAEDFLDGDGFASSPEKQSAGKNMPEKKARDRITARDAARSSVRSYAQSSVQSSLQLNASRPAGSRSIAAHSKPAHSKTKSNDLSAQKRLSGNANGSVPEPLRIRARIQISRDHAEVDFSGSAPQCAGNVNAVEAIAISAVYYVFRCLLTEDVPATSGLMRPIKVIAPSGTIVNATPPAAVAGGNVETSQRMVDTLFRALAKAAPDRIPAASQGTMNNLTLGGRDPRRIDLRAPQSEGARATRAAHRLENALALRASASSPSRLSAGASASANSQHDNSGRTSGAPFAYYETIAGGMGARPGMDGLSAVHTHMTNSWNTPIEVFEQTYPVRVRQYSIRRNSGGAGISKGGDGIIREIELLAPMQVAILSDRRDRGPWGLAGGTAGQPGKNQLQRDGKAIALPAKCAFHAHAHDVLRIETPGGGAHGKPSRKKVKTQK